MKIRSYKGHNLEQLHETIRKELGPEAVVVCPENSGRKGGWLGGRQYELIAVVDDEVGSRHALGDVARGEELRKLQTQQESKLAEMEQALQAMNREMRKMSSSAASAGLPPAAGGRRVPDFARDWDPRFVAAVREQAPAVLKKPGSPAARNSLASMLRVHEHFVPSRKNNRPHVVVVTGPTGSGKTTTLAKLAAIWRLNMNLRVGLITLDTYRVAAVDQTREYATLLGLELQVAFTAAEVRRALDRYADMDVVLVDTPGRNPLDAAAMAGLRGIVGRMEPVTTFLLIPAPMNPADACELIRAFRPLEPDYLVITKIDETRRYPVLAAVGGECEWPVAFLTNGQRVPNDILHAERVRMADLMMSDPAASPAAAGLSERAA